MSTTITINFSDPTPIAVAEKIGTGAWNAASLLGSELTLTIPQGESRYAFAYVCPDSSVSTSERVVEATTQDPVPAGLCPALSNLQQGAATGSVDASAIPAASNVLIYGPFGVTTLGGVTGTFSFQAQQGNDDIAFVAVDASQGILAIKILRSQAIPGTVNGGQTVVFAQSDVTTHQTLSLKNVPPGFTGAQPTATYETANGTLFPVSVTGSQYALVPGSEAQAGDRYLFAAFERLFDVNSGGMQVVTALLSEDSPTAVTLNLPSPMTFSAPVPAAFPVFNLSYSGFAGDSTVLYSAGLSWIGASRPHTTLTVTATAAYQVGTTTLAIPDLTDIAGFLAPPAPATWITWNAAVSAGTSQSRALVENIGSYSEP